MAVEPTGASLDTPGGSLRFCSDGCRREFTDDPDRFPTDRASTTEPGVAFIPPGGIIET
jgi:YHS domain-containing protein